MKSQFEIFNPKNKKFWLVLGSILLALTVIIIGTIIHSNGLAFFQSKQFYITISEPHNNQVFYEHTYFEVSGYTLGDIPSKVYLWDKDYNIGILCGVSGNRFYKQLNSDDFARGKHVLCVQAVSADGKLSNIATVSIEIRKPSVTVSTATGYMSDSFPDPLRTIFRPVEGAARQIVAIITGGTDPQDINGDNIPDVYQISPVAPPYNPYGIPITFTLIAIGLLVLVVLIVYVTKNLVTSYISKKYAHEEKIAASPEARKFELEKLKLQLKIAKEQANPKRIKQLEERIAKLEKQIKQPIIINLGSKKIKKIKEEK